MRETPIYDQLRRELAHRRLTRAVNGFSAAMAAFGDALRPKATDG